MKSIRAKFGFICVLLLTVVMLIPSTASKYVTQFMTTITVNTVLPYHNIWWSDSVGSVTSVALNGNTGTTAMNVGVASGSITLSNNAILISKATDPDLQADGYYLLIAKGGNGGRGFEMVNTNPVYFNGGYGGIVAGVINFKPSQGDQLFVYLGTTGKDAECQKQTNVGVSNRAGKNLHSKSFAKGSTRDAGVFSTKDSSVTGSTNTLYYFYNSGSGGGTLVFLNGTTTADNLLMVAGGGGSSAMKLWSDGTAGMGGNGGSNVISYPTVGLPEAHHYENNSLIINGDIFWGRDGGGSNYGVGGSITSDGYAAGSGSMILKGFYDGGGEGGSATILGGAGGGGYSGGAGGTSSTSKEHSGGGGGGASFVSSNLNITCDEASQENYITCMQYLLDKYFYDATTHDPSFQVNTDGTATYAGTDELERFSYFCLYYLGPSLS